MTVHFLAIWGGPGPTLISTCFMSCSSICSTQSDMPALAPPLLGQLGGAVVALWSVQNLTHSQSLLLVGNLIGVFSWAVSLLCSGSLIELKGTSPPLAHAHCPSGPLIQTGPAAPAFSTSGQQIGINLWVCIYAAELQGMCISASKTPSPHTLVKTRFTEGRMMLSVIQGLVMWLSPWHFHLFGAELTFPKLHSRLHSYTGFTWIPPALTTLLVPATLLGREIVMLTLVCVS